MLVFALWWSYFKHSATERIRDSLRWTFVWALAHYLIFAAVAALGAGLQVAVGSLDHTARVTPLFAAFTVAIPLTTFMVVLGLLNRTSVPAGIRLTLLAAALILATAAAAPILTLPASIVIMVVLVALLLAYYLTAAHRATG